MTIEQTKWFKSDVNFITSLTRNRMYLVGWKEEKENYKSRYIKLRGENDAHKVFAKVNQKLKKKEW